MEGIDYESLTPMMKQLLDIKKKHSDSILLTRMGDFYEMFFEDAKLCARELDITLTSRGSKHKAVPLAGIPYHAADSYIAKLVKKGYKVTICEQLEDPKKAKGLVKRGVVKTITPGAVVDSNMLDSKSNNYIMSVVLQGDNFGIALADISTGTFLTTSFKGKQTLMSEIARFSPKECILPSSVQLDKVLMDELRDLSGIYLNLEDDSLFNIHSAKTAIERQLGTKYLESFGIKDMPLPIRASGALLSYISSTQRRDLAHINSIHLYSTEDFMTIDSTTKRNLEIESNIMDMTGKGTLAGLFDKSKTPMGSRLVKDWLLHPLLDPRKICMRQDAVQELSENIIMLKDVRDHLDLVYDIERITSRVGYGNANARDLVALKKSLMEVPKIKRIISSARSGIISGIASTDPLSDIADHIDESIDDEPSAFVRDGGVIKKGFDNDLDELRSFSKDGKRWIARVEEDERQKTGIKSLKVKYNKVFGYFIEVTRSNVSQVPENYIRKQTMANCERYITAELKEKETQIMGAEDRIRNMEVELFEKVVSVIKERISDLQKLASYMAKLDALCSFSELALENNYKRPIVDSSDELIIKDGRHPTVETMPSSERFVPNDTNLDCSENMLNIITGPNMAGKSTYMRQVALIVLMAQAGSFVPASYAKVGVVDRIFTRVGAHDDLSTGQSTFMVEMNETANILNNATSRSLIILDEIGRGTSTYDGLSIAWSVCEFILFKIGAKTLFATHYHHMNKLKDNFEHVKNYHISVKEEGDRITFLRKIKQGGVDKSYGVEVARLAGLPVDVIERAKQIQSGFENSDDGQHLDNVADDRTREIIEDLSSKIDAPEKKIDRKRQTTLF